MPAISASSDTASHQTTASLIIKDALLILGAVDPSENLDASTQATGLRFLNRLLDSLNTEPLMAYDLAEEASVVTNLREPTIGPGGTMDTIRPSTLKQGQVWLRVSEIDYQLREMQADEWAAWAGAITPTGQPLAFWYEASNPLGILHFDITPDTQYQVVIYKWKILNQISNVNASLLMPPGLAEVLVTQLVLRLAPTYGKNATPDMIENATIAKAHYKRTNIQPIQADTDLSLMDLPAGYVDVRSFNRGF